MGYERSRIGEAHDIEITIVRIYHEHLSGTKFDQLPFGITAPQSEALLVAVREGYFDIPRRCSTTHLADEIGISEQAVSERLRRGIANFVRQTLFEERDESGMYSGF